MSPTLVSPRPLGWLGIVRLGLVQTGLGAIVVLTTSTLNRVMVIELALPAMLPGALVAIHYVMQMLRPRLGHGSDVGGRRTPWIVGGMAVLALGGTGAAGAVTLMGTHLVLGIALAIVSFVAIGLGVGAAGTSLLVLLAKRVDDRRKAAAATIVWVMMIAGFIVTATTAGKFLDPYSPARLLAVAASVSAIAFIVTVLATWGVEGHGAPRTVAGREAEKVPFRVAMRETLAEPMARRFAIFVFISMLAYSGQDLILEPFAGLAFGYTPGQSTALAGVQNGGVLIGMILVGALTAAVGGRTIGNLKYWALGGCVASAFALAGLAVGGHMAETWPLKANVFFLGFANGVFAVAAIGAMMGFVGNGKENREGVRMGLWGAAQAIAFGVGGFLGTVAVDATRALMGSPVDAYAVVFLGEAALFLVAAWLAARLSPHAIRRVEASALTLELAGDGLAANRS
jgi:BCD family chlorophyll transporter-like MFS transporter